MDAWRLSAQQFSKRSSDHERVYAWSVLLLVAVVDPSYLQLFPFEFQTEKLHQKNLLLITSPFHLPLITFSTSPPSCQVGPRTPSWKEQTNERRLAKASVLQQGFVHMVSALAHLSHRLHVLYAGKLSLALARAHKSAQLRVHLRDARIVLYHDFPGIICAAGENRLISGRGLGGM